MQKKKTMLTVLLLGAFLFGFAVWGAIKPADAQSQSERRSLAQFPAFSVKGFGTGNGQAILKAIHSISSRCVSSSGHSRACCRSACTGRRTTTACIWQTALFRSWNTR